MFPDKSAGGSAPQGGDADVGDGSLPLESLWAAGLDGGMGLEQLYRRRCPHERSKGGTPEEEGDITVRDTYFLNTYTCSSHQGLTALIMS